MVLGVTSANDLSAPIQSDYRIVLVSKIRPEAMDGESSLG